MKPVRVIVHSTATPDKSKAVYTAADIRAWHLARGFKDIGYHRVIRRDGMIEMGRPDNVMGAHTQGFNPGSLGVCYVGSYEPTLEQVRSMIRLYLEFSGKYKIPWSEWYGHREFKNTECPGFHPALLRMLLSSFEYGEVTDEQIRAFLQAISVEKGRIA